MIGSNRQKTRSMNLLYVNYLLFPVLLTNNLNFLRSQNIYYVILFKIKTINYFTCEITLVGSNIQNHTFSPEVVERLLS
jgi:hypothetical protein